MSEQQAYAGQADRQNGNDEWNRLDFAIRSVINRMATATLVRVEAGNGRTVDVRPIVAQLDGAGNAIDHGTIHNVPVFQMRAGVSAVILEPVAGDIGLAVFCHSDISSAKKNSAPSTPGSLRRFDWADALYLGGFLGAEPTQFIRVSGSGIELNAPQVTTSGGLSVGAGATGSLTDATGRVATFVDGVLVGLS